jgi:hypothetical protein
MIPAVQIDAGDIIAGLALVLAIYSTWITSRFNKRQTAFEETAEQLNRLLIEKEASEAEAAKRADVSANFYKSGKHDYRLKVFNRGRGTARNVRFEALDGSDLFIDDDIRRKFPIPLLEQHGFIELIAAVHFGSPSRAHIKLLWDDEGGNEHQKELHPTW